MYSQGRRYIKYSGGKVNLAFPVFLVETELISKYKIWAFGQVWWSTPAIPAQRGWGGKSQVRGHTGPHMENLFQEEKNRKQQQQQNELSSRLKNVFHY